MDSVDTVTYYQYGMAQNVTRADINNHHDDQVLPAITSLL